MERCWLKDTKLQLCIISPGDVRYNNVTIVNNTTLCNLNLVRGRSYVLLQTMAQGNHVKWWIC